MSANEDFYTILGVNRSASIDDIKKAFRKLSLKYHPDRQVNKTDSEKKAAEVEFKKIAEAYSVLSDPEKRQQYDQFGRVGGSEGFSQDFDLGSFFRNFAGGFSGGFNFNPFNFNFGNNQDRGPINGKTIKIKFPVDIFNYNKGFTASFTIEVNDNCPVCKGEGRVDINNVTVCPMCNGAGYSTSRHGNMITQYTCMHCHGTGKIIGKPCTACNSTGKKTGERKLSISYKQDGQPGQSHILFKGQGEPGMRGGSAGDIIVDIVPESDKLFEVIPGTHNLHSVQFISPISKLIDKPTKVNILTPYGIVEKEINLSKINTFTLPNHGLSDGNNKRGTLIVNFDVDYNIQLTSDDNEMLSKLNERLAANNSCLTQKSQTDYLKSVYQVS